MIGELGVVDPDNDIVGNRTENQTFTFEMLENSNGRFFLDGNTVKVSISC